ncbi:MAG: trigger factor [Clostridia bacterium]|nr:trigger factor [Clostridia bacterium]
MATFEKLEHDKAKLTVSVSAETFEEACQKAYLKTRGRYYVPGFRKGKAPRKVIENAYGAGIFYEDAFESVWADAYEAALDECKLEPVDRPQIDIENISKEEGVVFTAEVQLKPEVKLGAYTGEEVEYTAYEVADEAIEHELEHEREHQARFVDVERPVENGDHTVIDYSGSVDGELFDGGTAEQQHLEIGSGMFIPGFEEQLIGMNIGEERDINVKFPEEYHAENLKGKDAVFHVKLHQVQVKELPAIDDEFIKDISEYDTVDAWKAAKRAEMEKNAAEQQKAQIENAVIRKVASLAECEVPACMADREATRMLQEMDYNLQASGMNLQMYCQYIGTTVEDMKKQYLAMASERVKMQLVLEAIAAKENITCSAEELEAEIDSFIKEAGQLPEGFRERLTDDDKEFFSDRKVNEKTVNFLVENAKLVERKEEAAEEKTEA